MNNINLERDARYVEAKNKLNDLRLELRNMETERDSRLLQINENANGRQQKKSKLDMQAEALLNGADVNIPSNDFFHKNYAELTEKIAIHNRAIEMHKSVLDKATMEVSESIALEVLPKHRSNVKAIVFALLELEKALADEHKLRDQLYMAGVNNTGVIRAMPFKGIGQVSDNHSYISRYLLECLEFGFITKKELPASLHSHIPSKTETTKQPVKLIAKAGDWLSLD